MSSHAIKHLCGIIQEGDVLTYVLRKRSATGMTRWVDVYLLRSEPGRRAPNKFWLTNYVAQACDLQFDGKRDAIRIRGVGFDVATEITTKLSHALFGRDDGLQKEWL